MIDQATDLIIAKEDARHYERKWKDGLYRIYTLRREMKRMLAEPKRAKEIAKSAFDADDESW